MGRNITASCALRAVEDVMACEFGDGLAVLHHDSGAFFVLDDVGAFIWRLLEQPHTPSQIASKVEQSYDASADIVEQDVGAFIQTMVDSRLFEVSTA